MECPFGRGITLHRELTNTMIINPLLTGMTLQAPTSVTRSVCSFRLFKWLCFLHMLQRKLRNAHLETENHVFFCWFLVSRVHPRKLTAGTWKSPVWKGTTSSKLHFGVLCVFFRGVSGMYWDRIWIHPWIFTAKGKSFFQVSCFKGFGCWFWVV